MDFGRLHLLGGMEALRSADSRRCVVRLPIERRL